LNSCFQLSLIAGFTSFVYLKVDLDRVLSSRGLTVILLLYFLLEKSYFATFFYCFCSYLSSCNIYYVSFFFFKSISTITAPVLVLIIQKYYTFKQKRKTLLRIVDYNNLNNHFFRFLSVFRLYISMSSLSISIFRFFSESFG
jgi:hypothetical protein